MKFEVAHIESLTGPRAAAPAAYCRQEGTEGVKSLSSLTAGHYQSSIFDPSSCAYVVLLIVRSEQICTLMESNDHTRPLDTDDGKEDRCTSAGTTLTITLEF